MFIKFGQLGSASSDSIVILGSFFLRLGHQKLGVTLPNTEEGWTERERRFSMYSVSTDASTVSTSLQFSDTSQSTLQKLEETKSSWQSQEDFDLEEACENDDMNSDHFGYLLFNTDYDDKHNRLTVILKRAEDLPYMGQEKTYDTFVRVTVLPCKRKYFKSSRIVKNALNPEFQEYLTFPIEKKDLQKQTLRLSLFDYSRQGRHDAIGHILVPMYQVVLQRTKDHRLPLTPQSLPLENLGQVLLALSYSSTKSLLTVSILRGRDYRINPAVVKTPLKNLCSKGEPLLISLMSLAFAVVVLVTVGFTIYRRRKNQGSYEEFPQGTKVERSSRRSTDASMYGCITQERPINFVVPAMSLSILHSPGETSLSSSSSPDAILGSRLSLIDNGPLGPSDSPLLGGLNPELYKVSYDNTGEEFFFPDGHRGRLWFSLEYDATKERLVVQLIKGKNFPSRTLGSVNCCDPFVRIFLLPDERRYLQTKIKKKTCNPKFEENFVFQIPNKAIEERTLKFTVFDSDRGKKYNLIGHVIYPLKDTDVTTNENVIVWRDLEKDVDEASSEHGEMLVSMTYSHNLERLTVTVFEVQGLRLPEDTTVLNTYVKITFMLDNKPVKTKKSLVAKKTAEPKYNETFIFRLAPNCVNTASFILQVMAASGSQKDKSLGRVVLGSYMFARGKAMEHWNEVVTGNHRQVRCWHKLT
ncbi:synaptotagmin-15-like isoform X3 [Limulus polyphemus]|uniref:Synaptotagmin-15-like isoform X3 n=1 Tax=Limulus polyphemus TaxID=6850 RepID=A0ABM1SN62_LIMPO|nr:synaptotagmin-15-like isoform X3 [Limulus polyphemus]